MRIVSWNVNGLRACVKKGFPDWLKATAPDIVGLQEVRANADQLDDEQVAWAGYHSTFVGAVRKGYSGVALLSKRPPDSVITTLGVAEYDDEGRVVMARFGKLTVVSTYIPNGNGKERDNSRIPFKLAFQTKLFDVLEAERARGGRIIVMGDINTAPHEIDLARPKDNVKTSGFRPEERAALAQEIARGYVDTFREFEKGPGHYSWWSSRFGVREKNIGWRIDLVLATPATMPFVQSAFIEKDVRGSDHAPIGITVRDDIVDASPT